jgi:hypothetical protein
MNHLKKMKTSTRLQYKKISYYHTKFQGPRPILNVASVAPNSKVRTAIVLVLLLIEMQ